MADLRDVLTAVGNLFRARAKSEADRWLELVAGVAAGDISDPQQITDVCAELHKSPNDLAAGIERYRSRQELLAKAATLAGIEKAERKQQAALAKAKAELHELAAAIDAKRDAIADIEAGIRQLESRRMEADKARSQLMVTEPTERELELQAKIRRVLATTQEITTLPGAWMSRANRHDAERQRQLMLDQVAALQLELDVERQRKLQPA